MVSEAITNLLDQLDSALKRVEDSVALPVILPNSAHILMYLEHAELKDWSSLHAFLRVIWGEQPQRLQGSHISPHHNGPAKTLYRLFRSISSFTAEEETVAMSWITALLRAVASRIAALSTAQAKLQAVTVVPSLLPRNSSSQARTSVQAVKAVKSTTSTSSKVDSKSKCSIKKLRSPPSKRGVPSIISGAPGARANPSPLPPAAKAHTEPSKLEWAAPLPPPSDSTSTELNAPAPPSALLQLPSSTRRTSSSAPAPPSLAPQKRKATTSSPSSPARRTRSVTSDRPLRAVRIPPKLSSEGYAGTEREAEEEDAHEEAMFEVGSAVMAKFPSYSWWCAIVLDPSTAPEWTQGKRTPWSYLVKSIPTGGDHRWVAPAEVRPLSYHEVQYSILPGNYAEPPLPSWRHYREELVEGCTIAVDEGRLAEWAKELTDSDIARTTEAMKKRRGSREMKED